jgi:hypothetical protein
MGNGWVGQRQRPYTPRKSGDCTAPGISKSEIARRLNIGRTLVRRILA